MADTKRRVCLLTGAGGRLGNAFCQKYGSRYHIAAVYHNQAPDVPSQRQRLRDPLDPERSFREGEVFTIQADLLQEGSLQRIVELTLARFDTVDVLIHNAADLLFVGPLLDADRQHDRLRRQLELNVMVPMRLTAMVAQSCWRDSVDENRARNRNVINVSSVSGLTIVEGCNQSMYSASKAALNYLSCHMGSEFRAIGVRANALAPTAFPRLVPTEQVADALVRLDESDTTGRVMIVDEHGERFTP